MHRETIFAAAAAAVILSLFVQSEALPGFVDSLQRNVEVRDNPEVIIKNRRSGLVLGADEYNFVVVQQFDGSPTQIWIQEPYNGNWTFMNKANGLFLDVDDYTYPVSCGMWLLTREHSERSSQHWLINPDGTILNGFSDIYAISITKYTPGIRLIVSIVEEDCDNQIFDLVMQ